jgi:hypothetical protein
VIGLDRLQQRFRVRRLAAFINAVAPISRTVTYLGAPPPVTVLCGSTRYYTVFAEQNLTLTLAGHVVLSIGCDLRSDADLAAAGGLGLDPAVAKKAMDDLHKRKIDIAAGLGGRVLVVSDASGYFGSSTRGEIDYARDSGVPVDFLVPASAVLDARHRRGMFP